MDGLIGDSLGVVLAVLGIALQVIHLIEPQHDVVVDVSDLKDSQQLQLRREGGHFQSLHGLESHREGWVKERVLV